MTRLGSATRVLVVLFVPFVVLALVLTGVRYVMKLGAIREASDGICGTRPGTTLIGLDSPFGKVGQCTVLDHGADVWGDTDGSVTVLLTTDRGLVALRIDYADLDSGRWYRSEAHELPAADAPAVRGAMRQQLAADIATRGGVQAKPWVLSYGDG